MSGRIHLQIGAPVRPADATGLTERPVTARVNGKEASARCYLRVVNNRLVWSIGECSDEAFAVLNSALARRGSPALLVGAR